MKRQLQLVGASVDRPDERHIPLDQQQGPSVALHMMHADLKAQPVESIRLTERQAVRLAGQLLAAVERLNGGSL